MANALVAICLVNAAPAAQASTTVVTIPLRAAVTELPVHRRTHAGSYDRTAKFGAWITQHGECDTRAVVLQTESLVRTAQNAYCTVSKGKWFSFYNGRYYYNAYGGTLQIDHLVPVENAWVSGAWSWTRATRVRYFNDLGDPRSLVAVDASDNESKGAQTPATWLPDKDHCRYVRYWVAVKTRWRLSVTAGEKSTLTRLAGGCVNTPLRIDRAAVDYR